MGECTDLLEEIRDLLQEGTRLLNSTGDPVDPALEENGSLEEISSQLNKLDFEEGTSALVVKALLELSELKIGAVEIEDRESGLRAEITEDNNHYALYVQSASLLGGSQFIAAIGEAIESPAEYTLLARLAELNVTTDGIGSTLESLTFNGDYLEIVPTIIEDELPKIPATNEKLDNLIEEISFIGNEVVGTPLNISFSNDEISGAVGVLDETDILQPEDIADVYLISFRNPSEETGIEIQLYLREEFYDNQATPQQHIEWCKHGEPFTIPSSPDIVSPGGALSVSAQTVLVEGAFMAQGLGISAKLADGTGESGAFDLSISIRVK